MDFWRIAHKKDIYPLIEYICREEWRHVHLSSRLYNHGRTCLPGKPGARMYLHINDDRIKGAFCWTSSGSFFPAFEPEELNSGRKAEILSLVREIRKRLYAFIGMENRVCFLETALPDIKPIAINYRIMKYDYSFPVAVNNTEKMRKAGPEDIEKLLPLEIAYQKEEVLLAPDELDPLFIRSNLQRQLSKEWIYITERNGVPVAKAGTNAIGFGYYQMGGVYTDPRERRKGIGAALISHMLDDLKKEEKNCCLFVKETNTAALNLYKKIGFSDDGRFRISYYK